MEFFLPRAIQRRRDYMDCRWYWPVLVRQWYSITLSIDHSIFLPTCPLVAGVAWQVHFVELYYYMSKMSWTIVYSNLPYMKTVKAFWTVVYSPRAIHRLGNSQLKSRFTHEKAMIRVCLYPDLFFEHIYKIYWIFQQFWSIDIIDPSIFSYQYLFTQVFDLYYNKADISEIYWLFINIGNKNYEL